MFLDSQGLWKVEFCYEYRILVAEKYNLSRKTSLLLTDTWSSHSPVGTQDSSSSRQMMMCSCLGPRSWLLCLCEVNEAVLLSQSLWWSAVGGSGKEDSGHVGKTVR